MAGIQIKNLVKTMHRERCGLWTAQLVTGLKKTRPDILPEFKAKFALLQKEKPLPEEAQAVVNEMFKEVFGT